MDRVRIHDGIRRMRFMGIVTLSSVERSDAVLSVIAPLSWIERSDSGPRSGRFQNPERDHSTGQETMAAGICWKGSATT